MPKKRFRTKPLSIRYTPEEKAKLETVAFLEKRNQTEILVQALEEYIERRPDLKKAVEEIVARRLDNETNGTEA